MKDINNREVKIGDKVMFYTFSPQKTMTVRVVRDLKGKLYAGEVPLSLLDEMRRELTIIKGMENNEEIQYVYLKIYLNDDNKNLPKEKGDYYFGWDKGIATLLNKGGSLNDGIEKLSFNPLNYDPEIVDSYDWYFLPCEIYNVSENDKTLHFFKK